MTKAIIQIEEGPKGIQLSMLGDNENGTKKEKQYATLVDICIKASLQRVLMFAHNGTLIEEDELGSLLKEEFKRRNITFE